MAAENVPAWVDLSSTDPAGSRAFYAEVFGWNVEVDPDPQYGGYALAKVGAVDVAGIAPKQPRDVGPTTWSVYVGTKDADATANKASAAGGMVVMPPFDVPGQGRMAVFQDPSGAFVSVWQAQAMAGFQAGAENQFGWAELSARGIKKVLPFYESVFGWTTKESQAAQPGEQPYMEFQLGGESIAGAMEMSSTVPAQVPSYWMPYFLVAEVDAKAATAKAAGAQETVAPQEFPGGRFAIFTDPQGALFGLLKMRVRQA